MDVAALYPSIDVDFAVTKCTELILESNVEFSSVEVDELGLFLALTTSRDKLKSANLDQYCPTRTSTGGRPPTLTASGTNRNKEERWSYWQESRTEPRNKTEIKRMICFALGINLR